MYDPMEEEEEEIRELMDVIVEAAFVKATFFKRKPSEKNQAKYPYSETRLRIYNERSRRLERGATFGSLGRVEAQEDEFHRDELNIGSFIRSYAEEIGSHKKVLQNK